MSKVKVTIRVEITDVHGQTTTVERSVMPTGFGDNPIFFGDVVEQASLVARMDVVDAVNAVHGTAPHPAAVTVHTRQ